eukprot:9841-Eustigmatos_ZCMA.PRE.1
MVTINTPSINSGERTDTRFGVRRNGTSSFGGFSSMPLVLYDGRISALNTRPVCRLNTSLCGVRSPHANA